MTPRPAPPAATWFLRRFGVNTADESVIGDLYEQYQRGHGSLWYWRQVLSIVYMGLFREIRNNRRRFTLELLKSWGVWGILQAIAGSLLMVRFISLHPEELRSGIMVKGFPLLTVETGSGMAYVAQWGFILFALVLNVVPLLLVGKFSARSSRIHPQALLLAFVTTYVVWDAGWMLTNLLRIAQHAPGARGALSLIILRNLIALPLAAALIFVGGMKAIPRTPGRN